MGVKYASLSPRKESHLGRKSSANVSACFQVTTKTSWGNAEAKLSLLLGQTFLYALYDHLA